MLDVSKVILKHKEFFEAGVTKDVNFRLEQLKKLKKAVEDREKQIMDALCKDLHKSEFESYLTEIGVVLSSINYFLKHLKKWAKVKKVRVPLNQIGSKAYIYHEPYGTVLIIGPSNYPFQLVFEPLIGAIAAGNCVILKPSELTPNTAKVIKEIITETFDENYISIVEGGKEITRDLINERVDYIFFTGSVAVGKIIAEAAGKNLIPCTLELGGKSPCIVHNDGDLEVAARRIVWGKFVNNGQTCVAPDYLLVHKDVKNDLLAKIKKYIIEFYGESPITNNDYGRIVNHRQWERLINLIDKDKVFYGGEYIEEELYISPTIIDNVNWEDKIMKDEIFGPIIPVIQYDSIESIIKKIKEREKPLALYIFTNSKDIERKIINEISYGGGCVNDTLFHLVNPNLPFGGVGASGIGAYHGKTSFETFSHKKSIMKKTTLFDFNIIFPPYRNKLKIVKKLFK
ncbi:aldehyde dehydrogenase [Fervidicella metallireducens AeB]|uniref:Aldehyde dehydrogenase n=1 Tax=Fervidicella metallireducens AeB TaxID=1403537 RepID=A0A017RWC7_9CLOT|nr:aldehyde dehydrogenase [Fervidicella metallireducens]EYE88911.1 aldehyde dehydrogenase [Fervidicella metallireducens AeB]